MNKWENYYRAQTCKVCNGVSDSPYKDKCYRCYQKAYRATHSDAAKGWYKNYMQAPEHIKKVIETRRVYHKTAIRKFNVALQNDYFCPMCGKECRLRARVFRNIHTGSIGFDLMAAHNPEGKDCYIRRKEHRGLYDSNKETVHEKCRNR